MGKKKCLCSDRSCDLEGPPGNAGYFGDKSVTFYQNPIDFIENQAQELQSRVFLTRLAMKQTLVLAEHELVVHFLENCMADFYNGLKDNYSQLFGDSIMFAEEDEAIRLRDAMLPLFDKDSIVKYKNNLQAILSDWTESLDLENGINFYEEFKKLALAYNLEVFLGIHHKDDIQLLEELRASSTEHWHGVISIPFKFSLPFFGSGAYSTAMEAKERILNIIKERIEGRDSRFGEELKAKEVLEVEKLYNHLLLFSCALIPKGVGSILSILFELHWLWRPLVREDGTICEEELECILLEIARMYPPFIGGIRIASKNTQVGRFHVPQGTAVHISLIGAMRDPDLFVEPNTFNHHRWKSGTKPCLKKEDMIGFGTGPHSCIGRHYSWDCILDIAKFAIKTFAITSPSQEDHRFPDVKYLPCLRPVEPTKFFVRLRNGQ